MKKLLTLYVVLSLLAVGVIAQNAGRWAGLTATAWTGGTNNIAANTTNVVAVRLDCPQSENIVLWTNFKLVGAGTSSLEFILARGTEDSYETNSLAIHKWNVAANGTTPVTGITNIQVLGIPHLWLVSRGHNNANAVTNLDFRYGFKR